MNKFLPIITAIVLTACSSTATSTQYYQLPDSAFKLPSKHSQTVGINIVLSEPLKSNSLLYQTDEYTLHFAQKNMWAAPLNEALAATFANKLNRISSLNYLPKIQTNGSNLTIYLDRFQGTYRGETEISGYVQWSNGTRRAFSVNTPQQGDGYGAMLDSLNAGLETAAQQIAQ
ncbi:PqiC family protein [Wielerella bovis]|uniref:PqiC family protein n=1 Tax=Wielerella bovis TaxID=2917790 RepID=UPI00201878EC|nr:ABC-type transport auxiliary lipoprotein family protein [Wielerella bovis]MCG7657441.1 ABC-type transport auxiliary lipoprotein family protein [Wielerella bovis]MCG7659662.1 ABC-type transport auxiliary lipoprotein family protein [Wielerella bovis]